MSKPIDPPHGLLRTVSKISRKVLFGFLLVLLSSVSTLAALSSTPSSPLSLEQKNLILNKTLKLQIPFIENQGQITNPRVSFYAQTFGGTVYVTDKGEIAHQLIVNEPRIKVQR